MNNIKPQIVKIAKNILSGSKAPAIELLMGNKYNQNETVRYGRITFTKSKYINIENLTLHHFPQTEVHEPEDRCLWLK